jgi:uncharacterized protein (TIGR00369 family)
LSRPSTIIEEARRANDPNRIFQATPYARFLGISIDVVDDAYVCHLAFRDEHIGNPLLPALHGGVTGALLESAAIFHLVWDLNSTSIPTTINMSIDYLRPGRPVDTYASGVVTKQGRRVSNVRVEAWQGARDKPIAAAHGHFLLVSDADA